MSALDITLLAGACVALVISIGLVAARVSTPGKTNRIGPVTGLRSNLGPGESATAPARNIGWVMSPSQRIAFDEATLKRDLLLDQLTDNTAALRESGSGPDGHFLQLHQKTLINQLAAANDHLEKNWLNADSMERQHDALLALAEGRAVLETVSSLSRS